ncbi:MAG TPA: hypothetical protein VFQ91_08640, partial [Bryobacteraceae bacterium]|nr:hypothetical protein [Bryobacteraceae bacterium]
LRESEGKGHAVAPAILNNRITQAVLKARELTVTHEPIEAAGLNRMTGAEKPAGLTYLAAAIHSSRPDLQRTFPEPEKRDAAAYLLWLLTDGAQEYDLAPVFIAPLREQWTAALQRLPQPFERLRYRLTLWGKLAWLRFRKSGGA